MDPLSTPTEPQQPVPVTPQPPQPAPATNTAPIANQPAQPVAPVEPRPPQATPVIDSFARPVAPWPPANQTPSSQAEPTPSPSAPSSQTSATPISPQIAQAIGLETSEAAGAIPNLGDQTTVKSAESPSLNESLLGPAPETSSSEEPMTNNQADALFKQEDSTKKHFKKEKIKKLLKVCLGLILTILILGGIYLFWFGSKAAQNYKNTSSVTLYKDAFTEINVSMSTQPIDSAKLESGLNKLKIAEDSNSKLSPIFLGSLNPNYKKAKALSKIVGTYKESTKGYKDRYSYPAYLASLSSANNTVDALQKFGEINVQTTNSEEVLKKVKEVSDTCNKATAGIKDSSKPADMGKPTDAYYKALSDICTSLYSTVETTLKDKTGIMTPEDQTKIKETLSGVSNSASSFINGSGSNSFYINQLSAYLRAAHDEAEKLQQSAEAILKG